LNECLALQEESAARATVVGSPRLFAAVGVYGGYSRFAGLETVLYRVTHGLNERAEILRARTTRTQRNVSPRPSLPRLPIELPIVHNPVTSKQPPGHARRYVR
jgi:hypothetical protein